eukprot:TRINITY_DN2603_c0_g1_i1.p1 TRINITY_DN2603_c0_g1~~TRINITY_DN2603_c0_g1_i1.p1  ORF type:complete len:324 (+),score=118.65 TRINITY_DN2603_c0_g1_i1:97-1068(+)
MASYIEKFKSLGLFPGQSEFTPADIPDLNGKVALVTGGNSGIGKETCVELAKRGAKVYMGARNPDRALPALEEIKKRAGSDAKVEFLKLDLEDLSSVKSAAQEVIKKEKKLHLFFQNAGVMATPYSLTKDGFENQWGTNVVGHFALTKHLLPLLLSTAKESKQGEVRVINTSSYGHNMAPADGVHLEDPNLENYDTWTRYGQSKLGNILISKELTRRYKNQGLYSLSVHPGAVQTELTRGPEASYGFWIKPVSWLFSLFYLTANQGAITQLYAGTSPKVVERGQNGAYLIPYAREYKPSHHAEDEDLAKKVWEKLETQVEGKL